MQWWRGRSRSRSRGKWWQRRRISLRVEEMWVVAMHTSILCKRNNREHTKLGLWPLVNLPMVVVNSFSKWYMDSFNSVITVLESTKAFLKLQMQISNIFWSSQLVCNIHTCTKYSVTTRYYHWSNTDHFWNKHICRFFFSNLNIWFRSEWVFVNEASVNFRHCEKSKHFASDPRDIPRFQTYIFHNAL